MESTNLLEQTKRNLEVKGVKGVQFSFNADLRSRSPSTVCNQAAVLLSAYIRGQGSEYKPVGVLSYKG